MKDKLFVRNSPHIHALDSTRKIMFRVIVALLPCVVASVILFGIRALRVTAACVLFCTLLEIIYSLLSKREVLIGDFSAVVTGILLSLNLPVSVPIYACFIGSVAAVVVAKQLFGGIGQNFVNPALFGRTVMLICYPYSMTNWTTDKGIVDLSSGATPLSQIASGNTDSLPDITELILGIRGGCMGETCVIAIIIGFLYLVFARVINPIIPLTFVGSAAVMNLIFSAKPLYELMCGGLIFGAVFMATDYATSPISNFGKTVFGVGCGVFTVILRKFASAPEGVSYAIMFMNLLVPYINRYFTPAPFGTVKRRCENGGR